MNTGIVGVDIDMLEINTQQPYNYSFNCADGMGISLRVPTGDYSIMLRAYDGNDQLVSESPVLAYSIFANRATDLPPVAFGVDAAGGNFGVSWALAWFGGGYTTCASARAASVDLDVMDSSGNAYHDTFSCSAGQGTSQALPVGSYSVALRLYDANDIQLGETVLPSKQPIYPNQITSLGSVLIEL